MKDLKFKLTTECGYRWSYGFNNYYWKGWYKPRLFNYRWVDGVRVKTKRCDGFALGPIMFFWRYGS
jgi:hypothetical protein